MKKRVDTDANYIGIYSNGQTWRFAIDGSKPITELKYPEFYDVKVTSRCSGGCSYCYQDSGIGVLGGNIVTRFNMFFNDIPSEQLPFQIAFGGGEPTEAPYFDDILSQCVKYGISANYTTNGIWANTARKDIVLRYTRSYCSGVAVTAHEHLDWFEAVNVLSKEVSTNIHLLISDARSVMYADIVCRMYKDRIKHFVLLPLTARGRQLTQPTIEWGLVKKTLAKYGEQIAFGAGFHPYLATDPGDFKVSLYDPEIMSAYLDLETMRVTKSSFSDEIRKIG